MVYHAERWNHNNPFLFYFFSHLWFLAWECLCSAVMLWCWQVTVKAGEGFLKLYSVWNYYYSKPSKRQKVSYKGRNESVCLRPWLWSTALSSPCRNTAIFLCYGSSKKQQQKNIISLYCMLILSIEEKSPSLLPVQPFSVQLKWAFRCDIKSVQGFELSKD